MNDLQTQVEALPPAMSTAMPTSRRPSALRTSGASLPAMILGAIVASVLPALVGVFGLTMFDPVGFAVRSALPFVCGALVYAGLTVRHWPRRSAEPGDHRYIP
jgi:hypothetical protein